MKALKKLQVEACKIESEFYREVHALECRYAPRFQVGPVLNDPTLREECNEKSGDQPLMCSYISRAFSVRPHT